MTKPTPPANPSPGIVAQTKAPPGRAGCAFPQAGTVAARSCDAAARWDVEASATAGTPIVVAATASAAVSCLPLSFTSVSSRRPPTTVRTPAGAPRLLLGRQPGFLAEDLLAVMAGIRPQPVSPRPGTGSRAG